jgi:hypothetical protein
VPPSLAAAGKSGDTFGCLIPQTFTTAATTAFAASASATNALIVSGQQPSVSVTTATCSGGQKVVPNLVDTLTPTADRSAKTVSQAQSVWTAAGFTGSLSTNPAGAPGTDIVTAQSQTPYTCQNPTSAVGVAAVAP